MKQKQPLPKPKGDAAKERLEKALRANLLRRKIVANERKKDDTCPSS
jgi:hypothetical protein